MMFILSFYRGGKSSNTLEFSLTFFVYRWGTCSFPTRGDPHFWFLNVDEILHLMVSLLKVNLPQVKCASNNIECFCKGLNFLHERRIVHRVS